eukprot:scaffold250580_cov26-Tisochrysis_lutea.AAC.1
MKLCKAYWTILDHHTVNSNLKECNVHMTQESEPRLLASSALQGWCVACWHLLSSCCCGGGCTTPPAGTGGFVCSYAHHPYAHQSQNRHSKYAPNTSCTRKCCAHNSATKVYTWSHASTVSMWSHASTVFIWSHASTVYMWSHASTIRFKECNVSAHPGLGGSSKHIKIKSNILPRAWSPYLGPSGLQGRGARFPC